MILNGKALESFAILHECTSKHIRKSRGPLRILSNIYDEPLTIFTKVLHLTDSVLIPSLESFLNYVQNGVLS